MCHEYTSYNPDQSQSRKTPRFLSFNPMSYLSSIFLDFKGFSSFSCPKKKSVLMHFPIFSNAIILQVMIFLIIFTYRNYFQYKSRFILLSSDHCCVTNLSSYHLKIFQSLKGDSNDDLGAQGENVSYPYSMYSQFIKLNVVSDLSKLHLKDGNRVKWFKMTFSELSSIIRLGCLLKIGGQFGFLLLYT